jgi:A/G-specific adenine glycosylase
VGVKKKVYHFLLENMPDMPGDFNEGIMELGEVICVPNGVPLCGKCPICQYCSAYKDDEQLLFPVKSLKKEKKEISYYASIFVFQNKVALIKRSEGLLKNMYGFLLSLEKASFPYFHIPIKPYKHVFTHVVWNITGDIYFVDEELEGYIWANLEEIESIYAIPTAFLSIVQTLKEVLK